MDVYTISDLQSFRDSTTTATPTSDPTEPSDPIEPSDPTTQQTPAEVGVEGRGGGLVSVTALPTLLLFLLAIVTVVLSI